MIGRTDWFDLPVADLADAMSFYEGLLGWKYRQMEESPLSDYAMIDVGGTLIGGLRKVASPHPSPSGRGRSEAAGEAAILYFTVDKIAPKIIRARELGAEIIGPIVELGKQRGRYQWIKDREGNLIGLWGLE